MLRFYKQMQARVKFRGGRTEPFALAAKSCGSFYVLVPSIVNVLHQALTVNLHREIIWRLTVIKY